MTREEARYMSEVLKAYSENKTIQYKYISKVNTPTKWWDLGDKQLLETYLTSEYKLRIKPKPKLRPYANAEEFLKAQKEHGPYISTESFPGIGEYTIPYTVYYSGVYWKAGYDVHSNWEELANCTWQNGTPCGIIE